MASGIEVPMPNTPTKDTAEVQNKSVFDALARAFKPNC
jgi:hypothetical protein